MRTLTVIAAVAAYLAVVLLAATVPGPESGPESGSKPTAIRRMVACVIVLAGFLFIPPGSLPPLGDIPWGGAVFLACLFAGRFLCGGFRLVPALVLLAVFLTLVWYGWQRGIPGSPGNLGTYVAMPVWRLAEGMDRAAFLCLALASLLAAGQLVFPEAGSLAGRLIRLGACAFLVTLFLPWNAALFVSWPVKITAGVDFVLFWIKCWMVMVCVARAGTLPRAVPASVLLLVPGGAALVSRIM